MELFADNIMPPTKVRLEASTLCQLRCPACVSGSGEVQQHLGSGFLGFSDFKTFVDRNPVIEKIELSNWGEIFLNKELLRIMEYAKQQGVALYANNGANLNDVPEEVLEGLVRHRVRS